MTPAQIAILIYSALGSISGGHWLSLHWHERRNGWTDNGYCLPTIGAAVFWPVYAAAVFWENRHDAEVNHDR